MAIGANALLMTEHTQSDSPAGQMCVVPVKAWRSTGTWTLAPTPHAGCGNCRTCPALLAGPCKWRCAAQQLQGRLPTPTPMTGRQALPRPATLQPGARPGSPYSVSRTPCTGRKAASILPGMLLRTTCNTDVIICKPVQQQLKATLLQCGTQDATPCSFRGRFDGEREAAMSTLKGALQRNARFRIMPCMF